MYRLLTLACIATFTLWAPPASADGTMDGVLQIQTELLSSLAGDTVAQSSARSSRAERRSFAARYVTAMQGYGLSVRVHAYRSGYEPRMLDGLLPVNRGQNLVVDLPREAEGAALVIGAHYDTVPGSPGADDNLSGVLAATTVAILLAREEQLRRPIVLVLFDQEETHAHGSVAFANELRKTGTPVHSVHTLDMIAYDGDGTGRVELDAPDEALRERYGLHATELGITVTPVRYASSDHISFRSQGFAAVCLAEQITSGGLNPAYHSSDDTLDRLDRTYLARNTLLMFRVLRELAVEGN